MEKIVYPTTLPELINLVDKLEQVNQEPYIHEESVKFITQNVPLPEFDNLTFEELEDEWLFKGRLRVYLMRQKAWLLDPENFVKSYNFIDCHPALWLNSQYSWLTNNLVNNLEIAVHTKENNQYLVSLEGGTSIPPHRSTYYRDLRLDVVAESYEEAIIKFASRLNKFFNLDGTRKENVEYKKTDLEKVLEAKIEEVMKML